MIVVSDTSCISNLLSVGQAWLLPRLFGEVLIPPAVETELRRFHEHLPDFLKVCAPGDQTRLLRLLPEVDRGEAEAICLAIEVRADRLLIDETVGRAIALREGLAIIGIVGILITAKRKALLPSIAPVLKQLETQAGFRMSQSLKLEALRAVGEIIWENSE
jgi:hypothetical protein